MAKKQRTKKQQKKTKLEESQEWITLRDGILQVLDRHPEAKRDVIALLESLIDQEPA